LFPASAAWLPIDLPDGATITAVSAFVHDDDSNTNFEMTLTRQSFGSATSDNLALVQTAGTPGDTLLEFVTNATLDRSNFDYYLHVELTESPSLGGVLFFYEVDISYTTDTIE